MKKKATRKTKAKPYQPKTGAPCSCRRGIQRDNCPNCEGTGMVIDFAAIRARYAEKPKLAAPPNPIVSFIHCTRCLEQLPVGVSPSEWARISVGVTERREIAVWCVRHDELVGVLGSSGIGVPPCEECEAEGKGGA